MAPGTRSSDFIRKLRAFKVDQRILRCAAILCLSLFLALAEFGANGLQASEQFAKWQRVELTFHGPTSRGLGSPNPFALEINCAFRSPSGRQFVVPGFYDGDGKGGLDGDVWKVRFSADELGEWTYQTKSSEKRLTNQMGRFEITRAPSEAQGFWKWGRLEYRGTAKNRIRYLKFRDGPYWLKAGCDDPENFLGRYRSFDSLGKRRAAIDYLASKGINSLYIMTHNIGGDDRDVWPWIGRSAKEAMAHGGKDARFDVAKLATWQQLFEYMQTKGIVPYLVLEDDSAWKRYDHARYWREIIARFGYLPAVVFNMGEEHNENYRLKDGLGLAKQFRGIDPYNHPLGIHNVNRPTDAYVDSPVLDMTAIQTGSPGSRRGLQHSLQHNRLAVEWIQRCRKRGRRVLMVNFDEGRPEHDRRAWWSAYLGGGVWEAHVLPPYDRPHANWDKVWTELGGARAFMESLPFAEMQPQNKLVKEGLAFCLAKPNEVYAIYLPSGGDVVVELPKGPSYDCQWWNPANGNDGRFERTSRISGGTTKFTAPTKGDWAMRIVRRGD